MVLKSAMLSILAGGLLAQAALAGAVASKPPAAAAKPATARPAAVAKPAVAPADEYFGRMKLSILGISNTIHDTKLRESFDPANAAANFDKLSLAEDALEDWSRKYPHDTWLPGKAYYMSHEFWTMNTSDSNAEAERCRSLLFTHFASSPYAAKARTETAAMFQPAIAAASATAEIPAAAATPAAVAGTAAGAAPAPQAAATPHR